MEKTKFGSICWSELVTPDAKKAKAFYSSLFGWGFTDFLMDTGPHMLFLG